VLRERALAALRDLRATLAISDASTASMVGIARNTLASWRRGERAPYPATVRRLFEVHSVVAAATALRGAADAGAWFHSQLGDSTRVDLLRTDDGLRRLAAEVRSHLFGGVGARTLPDVAELEVNDDNEGDAEYRPETYAGPIVLPPKVD
jgi:transcriptional regulator with XRE-family HTH domain